MTIEKEGFELCLESNRLEISNKYGVFKHEDIVAGPKDMKEFAEKKLEEFIENHRIIDICTQTCIKNVAYDYASKEYIQLQAVLREGAEYWAVQKYDDELVYKGEVFLFGCKCQDEVKKWMHSNYNIKSCLVAEVFRSALGDCTNNGISKDRRRLYILSEQKGPFEPQDIRDCVYIEWREICGEPYINCKPAYFRKRWYMAGGNFLYTSDSRFRDITKSKYPIPIHDRYEGR